MNCNSCRTVSLLLDVCYDATLEVEAIRWDVITKLYFNRARNFVKNF